MKKMIPSTGMTIAIALASAGCNDQKQQAKASKPTGQSIAQRAALLKDLPAQWEKVMSARGIAGMSVVVVHGDEMIFSKALGVRDPQSDLQVDLDTMFYIASCTKSYMAMGIMALVEEGKVDLDAPVKSYLPRLELANAEATSTLTIRDLLSHAKGLNSSAAVFLDAYTGTITEDRYYHWLAKEKPRGTFGYTNVHFTLAGRVAEAVTGKSWKDFLKERIFEPAGMHRTTAYASTMYGSENVAYPCEFDGEKIHRSLIQKTDRVMHAAGGMGTTANDAAKWLRLNLNGGAVDGRQILSGQGIQEMHAQHTEGVSQSNYPGRKRTGYGLGWMISQFRDHAMVEHGGGYVGTAAMISFMPSKKLGVAVLSNAGGRFSDYVMASVYEALLDLPDHNMLERYAKLAVRDNHRALTWYKRFADAPVGQEMLSQNIATYAGEYFNEQIGTLIVSTFEGKLSARIGDLALRLAAEEKDKIVIGTTPGSNESGHFVAGNNGQVNSFVYNRSGIGEVTFERQN